MDRPIVFISHISEESTIAVTIKKLIDESFLGMLDVFVSSDNGESLPMGSRWLQRINDALKKCSVELILCSPQSIKRPWINFEAGAGWIRGIPVIPLCHSGMEPGGLPVPLDSLQAAKISDVESLKLILPILASAINARVPDVPLENFITKVKAFEEKNMFWNIINSELQALDRKFHPLFEMLMNGTAEVMMSEIEIDKLENSIKELISMDYLRIERTGYGELIDNWKQQIEVTPTDNYKKLFSNKECAFFRE